MRDVFVPISDNIRALIEIWVMIATTILPAAGAVAWGYGRVVGCLFGLIVGGGVAIAFTWFGANLFYPIYQLIGVLAFSVLGAFVLPAGATRKQATSKMSAAAEDRLPHAPRKAPPPLSADTTEWYVRRDGRTLGPISTAELSRYIEQGFIDQADSLWHRGLPTWSRPDTVLKPSPPAPELGDPSASAARTWRQGWPDAP
jgi:GYF domain 2